MLKKTRGVTLVELTIAIVLISVAAVALFSYMAYIKSFSVKAENYASATQFARQTLEWLSSHYYHDTVLATATDTPHVLPSSNLKDRYSGTRTYTVSGESRWDPGFTDSNYKVITVTVNWNDGSDRSLTLSVRRSAING